jgi:hypothetical protein
MRFRFMMFPRSAALAALLFASPLPGSLAAAATTPFDIQLPTANNNLFTGHPERFYMYVDRNFEGKRSKPWQGGGYGFIRSPVRTKGKVVYTRFHEGIDISPVKRDRAGNALDTVKSIGKGTVVYANPVSGRSNYGKYVVVEHRFPGGPFYSLYAHLAAVSCKRGDPVRAGSALGRMGCTGVGLNRTRSHVHLEFCMMLSSHFDAWHKTYAGATNYHGNHNGMNLAGMDIAKLFLLHRRNPSVSVPDFIRSTPIHFSVTVPRRGVPDILRLYPWLLRGDARTSSPSWEISFSNTGLPLLATPSQRKVAKPVLTRLRRSDISYSLETRGLLSGSGDHAALSRRGEKLLALITGDFPYKNRSTARAR